MELPETVIKDLSALVLAGTASEESNRLVREYARMHPEFARTLEAAEEVPFNVPERIPDAEVETLRKTRELLRLKTIMMAMGIAFLIAPFTFVFKNEEIVFLVIRDAPGVAIGLWSISAASWVAWWLFARRLRPSGL